MGIVNIDKVSYATAGFGDLLTHDLACGVAAAQEFFPAQRWEDVASQVDARPAVRGELWGVLEQSSAASGAPEAALGNLRKLRQPHTYVVATGQQAGFLGGPLYTLHKALSAVKLARKLEAEAQGRASFVPLFWVAGDDHDLAEIDHADFLLEDGTVVREGAALAADSQGRSACDVMALQDPLYRERLLLSLARHLKDDAAAARYLAAYVGVDMAEAFARLLYQWLGGLGLVVVQSSALRAFAAPILLRELEEHDVTSRLIHEAALEMQRRGYMPGFSAHSRFMPHFFVAREPRRLRVRLEPLEGGGFQERGAALPEEPRKFSRDELAALLSAQPQLFSADAALRPVVQQYLFPVVAAVLGPGEISYWAQLRKLHARFGVAWPLVVPRATLTLLDVHAVKALRKLGLAPADPELFQKYEALQRKVQFPGTVRGKLDACLARIRTELDVLAGEVQTADTSMKSMFDKARSRIEHELGRIAEKAKGALGQREDAGALRLRYLAALVRPRNRPQERVLNTGQFAARYPALAQDLLEVIEPGSGEHTIVTLE
ncbi:MAG: bacillithiol biosynthesis cysteine-adding enzyme BshC [Planctomycetota bacterium]